MVVVLPEPLTPTTRITCGRGKASISSGSATGARIFSSSCATTARTASSLRPRSNRSAASRARTLAAVRGPRSEATNASSIPSSVASSSADLVISPVRLSPSRSEVFGSRAACARTRRLAHAATPISMPSSTPRQSSHVGESSADRRLRRHDGPGPARNSRHGRGRPSRPARAAASRPAPPATPPCAARRPRAGGGRAALAIGGGTWGMRAAGVPRFGEKGKMWPITMSHSSIRRSEFSCIASVSVGKPAIRSAPIAISGPLRLQPRHRLDRVGAASGAASSASAPGRRRPGSSYGGAA